jgi:hypothetical protein
MKRGRLPWEQPVRGDAPNNTVLRSRLPNLLFVLMA